MKTELEIEIEKINGKYHVDYSFKHNGKEIEFSGSLNMYHSGRSEEYEFEPSWFSDQESEDYYDRNWEKVEDQI